MTEDEFSDRFQPVYGRLYTEVVMRGGYFTAAEGEERGLDPDLRAEALARGVVARVEGGPLRLAIFKPSPREREICAWLALGKRAVFSHRSALALLGLCEPGPELHLTVPRTPAGDAPAGVVVHVADVLPEDRAWAGELPVTRAARALDECAESGLDVAILERARSKAQRRKLVPPPADAPTRPQIADPALRLALASALDPRGELFERLEALEGPALVAWAAGLEVGADADAPLTSLKWADDAPLWAAVASEDAAIVRDLSGLSFFSALEVIDLRASRLAAIDEVAALAELEVVHLGVTAETSLAPLLACAGLRRVRVAGFEPRAHADVRAALEARGVVVDVVGAARPSAAPFVDPMLKLAVLEALDGLGLVDLPPLVPIDAYELDREHLDRLLATPLTDAQLAAVERLVWAGGGMKLQHLVWPQYDGEADAFGIATLAGIERLPRLRALVLEASVFDPASAELGPLRARGVEVVVR